MTLGDILKGRLREFEKRSKEIKKELTELHNLRNIGKEVEHIKFKELHEELKKIRERIRDLKKLVKR